MSTRRTRQELIEQGVLKEVPDNGKSASVNVPAPRCLFLTAWGQVKSSHQPVMAETLCSQTAGV